MARVSGINLPPIQLSLECHSRTDCDPIGSSPIEFISYLGLSAANSNMGSEFFTV